MSQSDSSRGKSTTTNWLTNNKLFPCHKSRKQNNKVYWKQLKKVIFVKILFERVCGPWIRMRIWGVSEALKEQMCMPALFCKCALHMIHRHTHSHASIMSLWSLQSNSLRQKSLKQPWFWSSCNSPSVSSPLNSHQPLLLPKITQERHSNPSLTTAQLGHKRGIKTHTKKETSYCGKRGKEHSYSSLLEDIYWWLWQPKNHTYLCSSQDRGEESVFVDVVCVHVCIQVGWGVL